MTREMTYSFHKTITKFGELYIVQSISKIKAHLPLRFVGSVVAIVLVFAIVAFAGWNLRNYHLIVGFQTYHSYRSYIGCTLLVVRCCCYCCWYYCY